MSIHAEHPEPYDLNLAGLIAFNPVLPVLRRALGPDVEVEPPIMWPGPEIELHRAGLRDWSGEEWVRIKLDFAGESHVLHGGREITDQRAADLLGISERAFSRGHALVDSGLKAGENAISPETPEVVEASTPEQRLATAQHRDVPTTARAVELQPRR